MKVQRRCFRRYVVANEPNPCETDRRRRSCEVPKLTEARGNDVQAMGCVEDKGEEGSKKKYFVGQSSLFYRRDQMEVVTPIKDGLVEDWDLLEAVWDYGLKDRLMIDPKEHPFLMAEPSFNPDEKREKTVEAMFEKYGVPALFLAKNPVLSSFSMGRPTSLVVDSGGDGTTITAVHDGYVLKKGIVRSPVGGHLLSEVMLKALESSGTTIKPRYAFKRTNKGNGEFEVKDLDFPNTTESYRHYMQLDIVADIKESICRTSETAYVEEENQNIPTMAYELPDGNEIHIGGNRFKLPEIVFQPELASTFPGSSEALKMANGFPVKGLPDLVIDCINKCDVDVRKELYNGVILTGGNSVFPNMKERLEKELLDLAPGASRLKVITPTSNIERRFSVWIGGSILASLGSFQQMWMSKSEYDEHGPSLIHRKAP